jgi:NitT/TauT family transport system substrate-binding protein
MWVCAAYLGRQDEEKTKGQRALAEMKKTIFTLVAVVMVVVAGTAAGCVKEQKYTGPVEEITLAAYAGDTGALVYIAQEQGYFADNGLDVTIKDYEAGKLAADALLADEADICTSADFVLVSYSFEHDDLRVLGTVALAETVELVTRKDTGINQPSDLKGRKVGITKKSIGEFFLGTFLIRHGLSVQDVEIADLNPSEIVDAIVNGDIDAGFTWEPNIFEVKSRLGADVISWPGQSGQDFYFVLITKEDWIENNPAAAERFIKSLLEAEDYIKDNSEEAKEFVKDRFDYESDYINYSWPKQEFAVILEQAMLITFEDQARWKIDNNLTEATEVPNYLDYIYLDALEEVKPEAVGIIR